MTMKLSLLKRMGWPCLEEWVGRKLKELACLEKGIEPKTYFKIYIAHHIHLLTRVAAPVEVKLRPKGLGLGADRTVLETAAKASSISKTGEDELKLVVGACVQLLSGKNLGLYGQVSIK